ncbi:unnamed protein product, partial [Ectocarpus sp. 12 AP-2014]
MRSVWEARQQFVAHLEGDEGLRLVSHSGFETAAAVLASFLFVDNIQYMPEPFKMQPQSKGMYKGIFVDECVCSCSTTLVPTCRCHCRSVRRINERLIVRDIITVGASLFKSSHEW